MSSSDSDSEAEWDPQSIFEKRKRIHIQDLTSDDDQDLKTPPQEEKAPVPKKRARGGRPKGSKNKKGAPRAGKPRKTPQGPRAKNWMLTIWFDKLESKESKELEFHYDPETMQYICGQIEYSESNDRKHWQVYVQFKKQVFASDIKKIWPPTTAHHERQRFGSPKDCIDYTKAAPGDVLKSGKKKTGRREDGTWVEFGCPIQQGQEAGLARAAQMIHEDATIKEIFEEVTATAIRHSQGIRDVAEVVQSKDDEPEFGLEDFKDWSDLEITNWEKTVVSAKVRIYEPKLVAKIEAKK